MNTDAHEDAQTIRKAITFAMDNASVPAKAELGGPIDIAIIYKNGEIEWVSRKSWCGEQDEPPTQSRKDR